MDSGPSQRLLTAGARDSFLELHEWTERRLADELDAERRFLLAGRGVRLRIAGKQLAHELPAVFFDNDSIETLGELEIDVLDSRIADEVRGLSVVSSPDDRYLVQRNRGLLVAFDRLAGHLVAAVSDRRPHWELAKPFSLPISVWLASKGVFLVHAGAVSADGRAALFFGASGSGKSTAVAACAGDLTFLGDDSVALKAEDPGVDVHPLYTTAALDEAHLERYTPGVSHLPAIGRSDTGKRIVTLAGKGSAPASRVAVLMLPRITSTERCRLVPTSSKDALLTAAPSSMLGRPVPSQALLSTLRELAERVPCYWLQLGRNLEELPLLVKEALAAK